MREVPSSPLSERSSASRPTKLVRWYGRLLGAAVACRARTAPLSIAVSWPTTTKKREGSGRSLSRRLHPKGISGDAAHVLDVRVDLSPADPHRGGLLAGDWPVVGSDGGGCGGGGCGGGAAADQLVAAAVRRVCLRRSAQALRDVGLRRGRCAEVLGGDAR